MLRVISIVGLAATMLIPPPARSADQEGLGRVAWVTDGDTLRLDSGERIRIARIDAPETHRDQAKCAAEITLGLRAKDRATALVARREIRFRRVCHSYKRTVATVVLDRRDLGTELVELGIAAWWPRGRPKPDWCAAAR